MHNEAFKVVIHGRIMDSFVEFSAYSGQLTYQAKSVNYQSRRVVFWKESVFVDNSESAALDELLGKLFGALRSKY